MIDFRTNFGDEDIVGTIAFMSKTVKVRRTGGSGCHGASHQRAFTKLEKENPEPWLAHNHLCTIWSGLNDEHFYRQLRCGKVSKRSTYSAYCRATLPCAVLQHYSVAMLPRTNVS
ncbi:unnamed protein product [Nippostrongylus brasiliensis]|uniref:Transposase n=1 Tax=Nippostrongylus brasiliensis TaxID=27835 RepID=A0A0N4YWT0_NIPBR|nr:unnamed protein product [Nippostrongylus brasiliensis]